MENWQNKRVLVIGAARQGQALARYLSARGASVTLNDKREAAQMQHEMQQLAQFNIIWALGDHPVSLLDEVDLVCLSGGVPLTLPIIVEAQKRGMQISNDSQIFMESVKAPVIAITGSAGKTTTTTLVGRMAEKAARFSHKAWVGGNIGRPLIDVVNQIKPQDVVVLEFSSFQLEIMDKSPNVAVILNITPNHLDRHGTMEAYTRIKSRIFRYQRADDWTILGSDDPRAWGLRSEAPGRLAAFGFAPVEHVPGAYIHDNQITLFDGVREKEILPVSEVELRGQHNLLNVLAACAAAQAAGFPHDAIRAGIRGFGGVPHRLEFVRQYKGAAWYNDSKATTPEGAAAATRSFTEPLIVLLGGRDKHLPWDNLAKQVRASVDHVIAFGEAAPLVLQAIGPLQAGGRPQTIDHCETLAQAVERAAQLAEPGDVVLLAPGGTSYDEFNNFEERGDRYKEWVNKLQP